MSASFDEPLFQPDADVVAGSQMTAFTGWLEDAVGRRFDSYQALHRFAVEQQDGFWGAFLQWSQLVVEGDPKPAVEGTTGMHARFFPALRLNFTENLLAAPAPLTDSLGAAAADALALRGVDELGVLRDWTRAQLKRDVHHLAGHLRAMGVGPGDYVVAVASNTPETVLFCLAAVGLGATWASAAPDMAVEAVLQRFAPLEPKVLLAHGALRQGGAVRSLAAHVGAIAGGLPSLQATIGLGAPGETSCEGLREVLPNAVSGASMLSHHVDDPLTTWPRLPFDHPLFVLFSSGTTGAPKRIVHSAGGTLLEHVKEHRLHTDLRPGELLYFHTTAGWMMWNWSLSALASGAAVGMYDGSVSVPDKDALLHHVAAMGCTVFGTSAAYIQYLEDAGVVPQDSADLSKVRLIQSTGSILYDRQYHWLRENWGPVPVHSISGGTDIVGCFVLGSPNLPVYAGESPCVSLGYDVRAMVEGAPRTEGIGELVCAAPFPSRPVGLHGDPDGAAFRAAYFDENPGLWTHGDVVQLTDRGTARILGRSDGTLNIRGVRLGPAEIYRIVLEFDAVQGAMAVEQRLPPEQGGSRLILFLVLAAGAVLDRPLTLKLKKALKERGSMNHVPALVLEAQELPVTHSGKQSERAVIEVIHGREPRNLGALRNPECLPALVAAIEKASS